jgi:hypothetical protein
MKLQCPPMAHVLPVAMIRDFGTSRFRRSCAQNTPRRVLEEGQKAVWLWFRSPHFGLAARMIGLLNRYTSPA